MGPLRRRGPLRSIAGGRGHVVAKAQDKVGYVAAHLDLEQVERVCARMPCAEHHVL